MKKGDKLTASELYAYNKLKFVLDSKAEKELHIKSQKQSTRESTEESNKIASQEKSCQQEVNTSHNTNSICSNVSSTSFSDKHLNELNDNEFSAACRKGVRNFFRKRSQSKTAPKTDKSLLQAVESEKEKVYSDSHKKKKRKDENELDVNTELQNLTKIVEDSKKEELLSNLVDVIEHELKQLSTDKRSEAFKKVIKIIDKYDNMP